MKTKIYIELEILEILEEKGDCSAPAVGSRTDELNIINNLSPFFYY